MYTKLILCLVPILATMACGTTKVPAPVKPPVDLASCVPDVWLEGSDPCACGSALVTTPECSAADCRESNTLVLRGDGRSQSLILRWSETSGTLSAVGGATAILDAHWTLVTGADPHLVETFDATKTMYDTGVTCSETKLVRINKSTYDRGAPAFGKAVLLADGSTWQGRSYK
jgi:hypothetical protein